ncbi:spermidine/putrescine ABC transporter substrate-binding protein [Streptosporangium sp. NBC_01755]|uniref:polyamine ABC transporter substrate-binding protein n=1 Tax=unclassified Streptosporangium TaxID=2632669 RepID=UPI002DDC0A7D|nr:MULTISPECIES: spermidine/putrescine ABC transporter substrate-binding protein [unclassified Streptosporangium]WSA23625.1 spermidine/putrescine ABC transporter substrate-binding protein [Streptosporangium sp. NBC_01810]WSC98162.1 spermidine/putrescine ABC transporter substrate-binding protein [Streptosporangium sp. NBC_01755]
MDPRTNPAFLRGMTQSRSVTRRDALRLGGMSAAALALTACGVQGKKVEAPQKDAVAEYWGSKKKNGTLRFANWPLYIDKDGKRYPSLEMFEADTGIKVTYTEAIQDIPTFFGKIQPLLAANNDIGYDLMVLTNGLQLSKAIALGYLVPLDHAKLPNFAANASSVSKNPTWDPNNAHTIPWAGGLTGIAYNPKYVDEVKSIADLWDPRYKGKVGMMLDTQEVANFGMFALGIDPDTSTEADWKKAGEKLKQQRDAGLVRKYYENDYVDALARGDIWITMAWSGDIFQQVAEGKDLRFVVPEEGGTIWTDNLCIPKTSQNPVDALTYMDYVYQPKIATMLVESINYITPVSSAKDLVLADAAKATGKEKAALEQIAESPMIFPSEADMAKLRSYKKLSPAEEKIFEDIFQPITQG